MKGFFNKILRIRLKTKTFQEETLPDSVIETSLGARGWELTFSSGRILQEWIPSLLKTG